MNGLTIKKIISTFIPVGILSRFTALLLLLLISTPAWAANGTETTFAANCSNVPTTNLNQMQISQFVNYTGTGYGYVAATASWLPAYTTNATGGATITVAGIPAGASIVAAYLEVVQLSNTGTEGGCYTGYDVNGTAYAGNIIGYGDMGLIWTNTAYGTTSLSSGSYDNACSERFNITPAVTAEGNGNYIVNNDAANAANYGFQTASIIVVYQNPAVTATVSVQIADGLFLWQTGDGAAPYLWLGDAPEPVSISFCGNTCANPSDTFTRIGGNQMPNDGVTLIEGYDTFDTPGTNPPTIILTEPGGYVLGDVYDHVGGGPPWADIETYTLPNSVVGSGTSSLEYWMSHALDDTSTDNKATVWLNALVNEVSCTSTTPTNTNTPTVTNTETNTNTKTPTNTNTSTNTVTNTQTNTNTPTPTNTNTPTNTFTNSQTNTNTPTPTNTNTVTNTETNTNTITPSNTNTNTSTPTSLNTNTSTNTNTPTNTKTVTNTPTVTNTDTNTNTVTDTPTIIDTNTNTATNTVTNTETDTNTETVTNTATIINTNTNTSTDTVTNTETVTNTSTSSPTNTDTALNTYTSTNTVTNTETPTNTATSTATGLNTNTSTSTDTPLNTFTSTNTVTNTNTATNTALNTSTNTSTASFTQTETATNTVTNSQTATNTATNTPVNTFTNTNTATASATNTNVNTYTATATATSTSTPISLVQIGKTVSKDLVNANDVLTYTLAVTISNSAANGVTVTDVLPSNMSFLNFASSNIVAGTDTGGVLKWIMPSPLPVGVYQLAYQTQVNSFVAGNLVLVNNAQAVLNSQVVNASVPVTVGGIYTIKINVYNEAGEVVKTIVITQVTEPVTNITLGTSNTITSLNGPNGSINIYFDGVIIGTWDGSNNSGQPVSNGNYKIQVDNIGQNGVVTSASQMATVNRSLSQVTTNVYNSAGEKVRTLYDVVDNSIQSNMINLTLSTNVLRPNLSAPPSQAATNGSIAVIYIETSTSPVTLTWDGTNDSGTVVTPGVYTIAVHWNSGNGETADITRNIIVVGGTGLTGTPFAGPNVLNNSSGFTTTFDATQVSMVTSIKVNIYTISGQLVDVVSSSGPPQAAWDASKKASGIYLGVVQMYSAQGGLLGRKTLKVLVMH